MGLSSKAIDIERISSLTYNMTPLPYNDYLIIRGTRPFN